jgi:DNA gyrase subunit B
MKGMDKKGEVSSQNEPYDASKILVFEGVKGIRKRPAMYVGSTSFYGIHHLFQEIVDNSVDEYLAGFCSKIIVTLYDDNFIEVEDNGRGIPVDIMEKYQKPALEVIMLTPHTGAKFENKAYKVSGGLHGVGLSVVNALSEKIIVEVKRNGNIYHQEFGRGEKLTELEIIGKTDSTGTKIKFKPDKEIFGDIKFDPEYIKKVLEEESFLNKGLRIIFRYNGKENEFYHENGIVDFVKELNKGKEFGPIIYFSKTIKDVIIEVAMQYTNTFNETILSFANSIATRDGGTHLLGLKAGLTKAFNNYAKKQNSKIKIEGEDCREGLTCVISVKLPNPEFEGQTKEKLGNDEVKGIVESVVSEGVERFLEEHPNEAKQIFNKISLAAKAREEAKKAKELVRKKSIFEPVLPGKLADCTESDPDKVELFIVEGESAGGSAKQGRDRHFQAVLPIRGKILNVEKSSLEKILSSKEIKALIAALGTAIAEKFDINKIRYKKIIIATDADSVTGDTPIFVYDKQKDEFFLTNVENFIESCDDTTRYKVLSFNEKSGKMEMKGIFQTIAHPLRTKLYEIKTSFGYPINVTSCHSIYVYENKKVVTKKGSEIKEGDVLVFPKSFPRKEKEIVLDLTDLLLNSDKIFLKAQSSELEKIPENARCELSELEWKELKQKRKGYGFSRKEMGKKIKASEGTIQQWEEKIDNVMPKYYQLQTYLGQLQENIEDFNCYIPFNKVEDKNIIKEHEIYLVNYTRKIKTKFKIDEDLAYLIGFFLGDGCFSPENKNPNRFEIVIGKEKSENYLKEISRIIKQKLGSKPIIEEKENCFVVYFHSFEFKLILQKLGILGKKANEKFIPNAFFNTKREIQESLLKGLLQSDGFITAWKDKKGKIGKAIYGWQLSSKELVLGILTILRQLGIFPNYSTRKIKEHLRKDGKLIKSNFDLHVLSVSTKDYIQKTKQIWKDHKDANKLEEYLKETNEKEKRIIEINNDFVGIKVKEIKEIKNAKEKFVYDFSIFGDQNFIAGHAGVLLHNTDGSHIKALLLTLFYRYFREVIEKGYLYVAQPPLYRIQSGKKIEYAYTDEEKDEKLKNFEKAAVQRFKGLGEMRPEELWETTLNPENRVLKQITIEDAKAAEELVRILMGLDPEERRRFITQNTKDISLLDI